MIDVSKVRYRLVVVTEDNKRYNIKDYVENLGWEENEGELAMRISFTVKNEKTNYGRISSLVKLGCKVIVYAEHDSVNEEVARGYVVDWKSVLSGESDKFEATCYDELYNLQESQDNIYYSSGIGTKSAVTKIFDMWKIPIEKYEGPNATHGKLIYKSEYLSDALLDILDDAKKKSGTAALIRATKGKVSILKQGSNKEVYHFEADNTSLISHEMSTSGMVTRVKVISHEDKKGNSSVMATVNGLTKYGVRQRIYISDKKESLSNAKSAAQDIINNKGKVQNNISVQSPDVPFIRKGDLVSLKVGTLKGYYLVKGIRHDAETTTMTMDLKKSVSQTVNENSISDSAKTYNIGDTVKFKGGMHYVSSSSGAKGSSAKAGKAVITIKDSTGKAHPWHLIHTDSESNVYGWVDDGAFE